MKIREDFVTAVESGFQSGAEASQNRDEIAEVLGEYAGALQVVIKERSKGKVVVGFHAPHGKTFNLSEMLFGVNNAGGRQAKPQVPSWILEETPLTNSLSANICGTPEWVEILRYEVDSRHGYPCSIIYGDKNIACSNKEQLITCLKNVSLDRGMLLFDLVNRNGDCPADAASGKVDKSKNNVPNEGQK